MSETWADLRGSEAPQGAPARPATAADPTLNRLLDQDRAIHDWYRFVIAYPPHLVREYVRRFELISSDLLLDPFCGTGTTLVEAKKQGIPSIGIEGHPFTKFAAATKVDWNPKPSRLLLDSESISEVVQGKLAEDAVEDSPLSALACRRAHRRPTLRALPPEVSSLLISESISPRPLHKVLTLLDVIHERGQSTLVNHERLAVAKTAVFTASNLSFGPEVGRGAIKRDSPVVAPWLGAMREMAADLARLQGASSAPSEVLLGDAREGGRILGRRKIGAVITSPPYPNEKDYTRTTRLEAVLLGFVRSKEELQTVKRTLIRSNTRGVYRQDDDDLLVSDMDEIQSLANRIEARRIELGKTSGFERMFPRLTRLYFGGMHRHFAQLRPALRPGARLAYVVGDQASYLRVMIRTGDLLGKVAERLGYKVEGIDLFRTRLATATKEQLREEVLLLRWPGS